MADQRMTRQRKVILDALRNTVSHPSADEVYRSARAVLPHISLGTVYRNLDALEAAGEIRRIEAAGVERRFDADTSSHYHIRCLGCGRIDDLPSGSVTIDTHGLRSAVGYDLHGCRLELVGLCPDCRESGGAE